ncbi:MAG: 3-oxoacyl-ACP synthase [Oligoflexia bacterium]|nr:MAG: 3-oxoacyl-ACP synthase [Oligoflexia bacterium]
MIGIQEIGTYLPPLKIDNRSQKSRFDPITIEQGVGFKQVHRMDLSDEPETLCLKAFEQLKTKMNIDVNEISFIGVVSQQIQIKLPNLAAKLHGDLQLPEKCISLDYGLGCAGFVQGVLSAQSLMESQNLKYGLLFNVETLSRYIHDDRDGLSLIFSDAATVCLLSSQSIYQPMSYTFGTIGKKGFELLIEEGELRMNGVAVYDFAVRTIPKEIKKHLSSTGYNIESIDLFCFHQAGKKAVEKIQSLLQVSPEKAPFAAAEYGNTGSCSIPFLLENEIHKSSNKLIYICGFGSGLAWAGSLLKRVV